MRKAGMADRARLAAELRDMDREVGPAACLSGATHELRQSMYHVVLVPSVVDAICPRGLCKPGSHFVDLEENADGLHIVRAA